LYYVCVFIASKLCCFLEAMTQLWVHNILSRSSIALRYWPWEGLEMLNLMWSIESGYNETLIGMFYAGPYKIWYSAPNLSCRCARWSHSLFANMNTIENRWKDACIVVLLCPLCASGQVGDVEMIGAQSGQAKIVFPLLQETCCNTKGGNAWSKE